MSDDELIVLESPPASPPLHIEWLDDDRATRTDIHDLPDAGTHTSLQVSPMKRSQVYSSYGPTRRKRRLGSNQMGMESTTERLPLSGSPISDSYAPVQTADQDVPWNSLESPTILAQSPVRTSSPISQILGEDWSLEQGPESFETHETLLAPAIGLENDADAYSEFVEAALSACLGIYRLTTSVFIVQGWDAKTATATRRWYHLQSQKIGHQMVNMCLCPNDEPECVHAKFLTQFGKEEFPDNEDLPAELGPVRLVFRDLSEGQHLFSVETPGKLGIKPRALVQHEGTVDGGGTWRCSKDGGQGCGHIHKARDYLQQLIYMNPAARDTTELNQAMQPTGVSNGTSSMSFKSIAPPVWAELESDFPLAYPRPPPVTVQPTVIRLEDDARCMCGALQNRDNPLVTNTCQVYTILGCFDTKIELQRCSQCTGGRHRFVGPDCREIGLFNYNNRIILSHDLLDEYTMAYTSSETPFTAWSRLMSDKAPIPKAKLRKNVRLIVDGPPLVIAETDDQSDDEKDSDEEESGDETEVPDSTPLDASVGDLFKRLYYDNRASVPLPYKRLFMQLSSRESILQVANQRALEALGTFNADSTAENMSLLLEIPCLYHVLIYEHQKMGAFSSDTLGMCQYIHGRGLRTLGKLKGNTGDVPALISSTSESADEWMKSENRLAAITACQRSDIAQTILEFQMIVPMISVESAVLTVPSIMLVTVNKE
ncbi:hypothetical protein H0H92_007030 [Tricholoma furcatifolium]|nr:hypothetical protein H0H92_007030 [Tricholoma furcatifolium]